MNKKNDGKLLSNILQFLSLLFLAVCLFGTIFFLRARYRYTLSSDESSELVLGNLIANEGWGILSKNWYYSTELRVFNTNILYSFFFHFIHSWHRVRVLSTVSLYLILLALYYGMSRVYHFRRYFALSAAVLFIPFSPIYYYILMTGVQYHAYTIAAFLTLLFAELFLKFRGWKAFLLLTIPFTVSVLTGMSGSRQLLVTYMPLLTAAAVSFLDRKRRENSGKWLFYSAAVFLGSVIGFLFNMLVLSKEYSFYTWNDVRFSEISFSRVGEILTEFLVTFGYTTGPLMSAALLKNFVSLAWFILTIFSICYAFKKREEVGAEYYRLANFTVWAYAFFIAFYMFTDAYHHERYNLPFTILSLPLVSIFMRHGAWKRIIASVALSALVLMTAVSGANYYVSMWHYDKNEELRKISAFLVDQGYKNGYSTFWRSNVVTEFSNGELDIWSIDIDDYDKTFLVIDDIDHTYQWLQKIDHDTTHPSGKIFLLFTRGEFNNNTWRDTFTDDLIIYRSNDYVILGYEKYDDMIVHLYPGYDFVFEDNEGVENGADIDGIRYLKAGGVSHTKPKHFWPGNYEIMIEGSNLNKAKFSLTSDLGANKVGYDVIEENDEVLLYAFVLSEKTKDIQTEVRSLSKIRDDYVQIKSVSIRRLPQD